MLSKIFVFKLIVLILSLKLNLVFGLDKQKFCTCQKNVAPNVVGGIEPHFNEYPWVASVTNSGYHKYYKPKNAIDDEFKIKDHNCTAFILNESWVITAKKCTTNKNLVYSVGFGNDKVEMFDNKIIVKNVRDHYDPNIDMSLLELAEPIEFNENLRPVCLDTNKYEEIKEVDKNLKLIATGYGIFDPYQKHKVTGEVKGLASNYLTGFTRYLKEVEMKDVSDTQSNDKPWVLSVNDAQEGHTVCLGDEGGPLHYTHLGQTFVVGLLSTYSIIERPGPENSYVDYCFGLNNAQYHKISPQIDWIKSQLGENNLCYEGPSMLLFGKRMAPNKKYDEAGPSNTEDKKQKQIKNS